MQEFIALKVEKLASSQQRSLLHTLIPPNVLDRMAGDNGSRSSSLLQNFFAAVEAGRGKLYLQRVLRDLCCMFVWITDTNQDLCTEIKHVTMMFCGLDYDVETNEDFHFLSCVLEALDNIVFRSGMHKYQVCKRPH